MTKDDDKRHKYALMMNAHRDEWVKFGLKQFKATFDKDRAAVRSAFAGTSSPEAAIKRLESYFKGPAYNQWETAMKTVWLQTGKATIDYVHSYLTGKTYIPPDPYRPDLTVTRDAAQDAAQTSWEQRVNDTIKGPAFKDKIKGVNDTTQASIRSTVADGVANGDGHYKIGQAVDDKLTTGWEGRGQTISRTEANSAMNAATHEDGKHAAPDLWKKWASSGMENVRPAHEIADEAEPVSQDDTFIVDDEELDYPGDPMGSPGNIINCACCIYFVDKPEGLGGIVGDILGDVNSESKNIFNSAVEREPDTTDMMKDIASSTDGNAVDLAFRLKKEERIAEKIAGKMADDPDLTAKEAGAKITDSLRYTITYDPENFVDNVAESQKMLDSEGYEPIKMRNYFGENQKGGYQGYNTVWRDSEGNNVELQYHTEESKNIKDVNHLIYQKARIEPDVDKAGKMVQEMDDNWKDFKPPANYKDLPTIEEGQ
jgi:hypothetical protein